MQALLPHSGTDLPGWTQRRGPPKFKPESRPVTYVLIYSQGRGLGLSEVPTQVEARHIDSWTLSSDLHVLVKLTLYSRWNYTTGAELFGNGPHGGEAWRSEGPAIGRWNLTGVRIKDGGRHEHTWEGLASVISACLALALGHENRCQYVCVSPWGRARWGDGLPEHVETDDDEQPELRLGPWRWSQVLHS